MKQAGHTKPSSTVSLGGAAGNDRCRLCILCSLLSVAFLFSEHVAPAWAYQVGCELVLARTNVEVVFTVTGLPSSHFWLRKPVSKCPLGTYSNAQRRPRHVTTGKSRLQTGRSTARGKELMFARRGAGPRVELSKSQEPVMSADASSSSRLRPLCATMERRSSMADARTRSRAVAGRG